MSAFAAAASLKPLRLVALPERAALATYAALLATRGAYVLSRLVVALALPLVLSVEALGKFGVFSGLVAALPVIMALGLPEHATRRLHRGLNRPIFRVFALQAALGSLAACAAAALWLGAYPDIDRRTILLVAGIVALNSLRDNLGIVLLGRGAVLRANVTFVVATSGPFFAVLAALVLPQGAVDLATLCLAWLVTCLAGVAIALPGAWRDLVDLGRGRRMRLPLLVARHVRIVLGLRRLYVNQIIDLARTYLDRMVLPLVAGFHLAGVYNVFALATSVAVMIPNALCGQVDLPRLVASARDDAAAYRRTVAVGIVRAAALAALIIAPLFLMRPAVNAILKLDLDAGLFYALCAGATLNAVLAAVADYLWYAIYAARAERELWRYAVPTIILSVLLVVGGASFGLIGASLAVAAANGCVVLFRARALAAHLRRRKSEPERVVPADGVMTTHATMPHEPRSIGLLPAYNAEATIADAAFSLFPTKVPFELLIVDDGSREPVADTLARDPRHALYGERIHILRKEANGGLIAALNDGLRWILARDYDYVVRMDSDDLAVPGRVDAQVAFMQARPHLLMAGSAFHTFENTPGDGRLVRRPTDADAIRRGMRVSACFSHPNLIVRTDAYRKVGLYDHRYLHAEDFDWTWRCMRAGPVANQADCLLHYRVSPTQISRRHWRAQMTARARVLMREFFRGEIGCIAGIVQARLQLVLPFRHEIVGAIRRLQARCAVGGNRSGRTPLIRYEA